MRRFVLGLLWLLVPCAVSAQPVDDIRWVPNGPVYAVARHDGITYVGGQFTMISRPSGAGVAINIANDIVPDGLPQVVGRVFTVVGDGAGGWYIGGLFTHVGGLARNNIAHLASDLSVYPWNPGADGAVLALAPTTVNTIYAGGEFTTIGGQARTRLAELDVNTGNATSMNIPTSSLVRALATSGSIMYVGGDFTVAGVSGRSHLCAIDIATRTLTSWNPGANGTVYALEVASRPPLTSILVGGSFGTLAAQPRTNLGEVTPAGAATSWNPSPNGTVRDIQEHTVDYVGGDFTTIGGQPRNHLAAVATNGIVNAWNPDVDGPVEALVWSNNHVFIGGTFLNVGGLPRRNAAKIDETTAIPAAWNPQPNNTVKALAPGGLAKMYAGGEFTGLGGVERRNLAAFDDWTGQPTMWDPNADGPVRALALRAFGPAVYAVYAGGDFLNIQGQPRAHLAALNPTSGYPTSWITDTNLSVLSIAVNDTLVAFGGIFTSTNGEPTSYVAARLHTGGPVIHFDGLPGSSFVYALAMTGGFLHVGGSFGLARFNRSSQSLAAIQSPAANGPVRALCARGTTVYAGGDFTTIGGQPRSRLAKLTNNSTVDAWNPGADGIVRAIVPGDTALVVGGDFLNAGGAPRRRIAMIGPSSGLAIPWAADVTDLEVWALSSRGAVIDVGGRFHGIAPVWPLAGYAVLGLPRTAFCGAPLATFAGGRPRALAVLDANADGIEDIAVCENGGATNSVRIMRGNGSAGVGTGLFSLVQAINLASTPQAVVAADFDKDGRPDLAVSESDEFGTISLFHNVAGTFQPWTTVPLMGRGDGLAAGDFDADGIVDLVACLVDSALTMKRGGLELFKGGGTNGTWDGTFAYSDKSHKFNHAASARRVVAHDFDQDGQIDFYYTGQIGAPLLVFIGSDLKINCENAIADFDYPADGFAIGHGDFNEDGRSDLVFAYRHNLFIRFKNEYSGCANLFTSLNQTSIALPGTPRDLAVMDVDRDGILDVVCAFDSLATLAYCRGGGSGGVADGTLLPPITLDMHDAWGIGLGDFVTDGNTDVVTSMGTCGYLSVWQNTYSQQFPMTITLDSPNGGESLSRTPPPSPPSSETLAVGVREDEVDLVSSPMATTDAAPAGKIASLRTISWTKGGGVHGVDVELSRNDGATWESIGTNMPGSSMTWYSTPPAATLARVRVRDAAYRGTMDASDAPFAIITGLIGTPPPGAPATAGLALLGRNPALGAVRFRLDVPQASDVAVVVYDAAGRTVRTLARRAYAAGTHDLAWDGADDRGAGARRGVYFVKSTIGSFRTTRKIVML